jgi:periplasmic mercuric ion binding protein
LSEFKLFFSLWSLTSNKFLKVKKIITLIAFFLVFQLQALALDTLVVQTSAQCEMCKARLENRIRKIAGIESATLNLSNKEFHIVYDKSLISPENIEIKITEIGYDANQKLAKKAAYKRLPACCRVDYQGEHAN